MTMPDVALVEVRRLVKAFDDHIVLDGIDFRLDRGETVTVIGGSGSGKSTLARLLIGLDAPTSGEILLDGVDMTTMHGREHERACARFAMVFQKYALLDSMTVYENVAFPLRERRELSEPEIHERVVAQLRALGVEQAAWKFPSQLSGGMGKRVGIARAMVMDPEILIYDEPTSGLDPVTSRLVDDLIEEVRERFLVTSLVITHDMATALRISDRVLLLDHGRFAVEGTPAAVFASGDPRMQPFALSSGIDPALLSSRANRKSPAAIRELWTERRAPHPEAGHHPLREAVERGWRRLVAT